jgi:hypothetical protein
MSVIKSTMCLFAFMILSACTQTTTNVDTALTPQPQAAAPTAQAPSATALASEGTQTSAAQTVTQAQTETASLDTSNAMTFLPVEGAPQTAITNLSKSLRTSASSKGLKVLSPTQAGSRYKVKGYFSALDDGSGTLLVYVWDVLDQSGKRVHRINGQERANSASGDPWRAITDEELSRVADRTTTSLKAWVDTKKS